MKVDTACVTIDNRRESVGLHLDPTTCLVMPLSQEAKRGLGTSAVFIARNRFAVLDKASNSIQIRNLQNEITKKVPTPCATTDAIFYAGTGMLLCRSEDKVCANVVCRTGRWLGKHGFPVLSSPAKRIGCNRPVQLFCGCMFGRCVPYGPVA